MRIYYLCAKTKQQYLLVSIITNGTSAKQAHTAEDISGKNGGLLGSKQPIQQKVF